MVVNRSQERGIQEHSVKVIADNAAIEGILALPDGAKGVVLFAHGSGSSRHSPRNRYVSQVLQNEGLATLLIDLLTPHEEKIDLQTGQFRFDIELLAQRLMGATDWLTQTPSTQSLNIGYFGASTGAGAALIAAVERKDVIAAIVSRGGRPDLAGSALPHVMAPTLLIVGENDFTVIALNRKSMDRLSGEKEMAIVPGATHLFEEPGTLEEVAHLASKWFLRYLCKGTT